MKRTVHDVQVWWEELDHPPHLTTPRPTASHGRGALEELLDERQKRKLQVLGGSGPQEATLRDKKQHRLSEAQATA